MQDRQTAVLAKLRGEARFRPFEREWYERGFTSVTGLDEVGRGPLAGPVVAAAVVLPRGFDHGEIKDSKLLSAKQRERLAPLIQQQAVSWGLGIVEVDEIDRINILQASLLAMAKALDALTAPADCLLIDGNQRIPANLLQTSRWPSLVSAEQQTIVKGDQLCLSIAAASIIAKVARDEMMVGFDRQYPDYGFAGHKGYGSAQHLAALRRHGPSPIHRKSFAPVRDLIERTPAD
ncbi:MAG: ribonuclease HII [Deltaproteobacteria bacterium]|nr:ribonuclease HII [Deltaproteobacteria bacterium]